MADQGALSRESEKEQKSAGLHELSKTDKQILKENNNLYKEKFAFPFVICVRLTTQKAIMEGIEGRLNNNFETEVLAAIEEIKKIGFLRLANIINENDSIENKM